MRQLNPEDLQDYLMEPDTVATIVLSSGVAQALDYPSGAEYFHMAADTRVYFNFSTTSATVPTTTIQASTSSTDRTIIHNSGHNHIYRIPSGSTGYSVIANSSAAVTMEFWKDV